jgi:hypothetical protein
MDQYISLFKELATEADYDLDSKPVMNLFQKGLNYKLNNRIFSFDPPHRDWDDLKRHTTLASNAEARLKAFGQQPFGRNPGNFRGRQGDRTFGVKTHCLFGSSRALCLTRTKGLKAEPEDGVGDYCEEVSN